MTAAGRKGPKVANRKAHEKKSRAQRKQEELTEIDMLNAKLKAGAQFQEPPPTKFTQLPISGKTLRGLEECHFLEMTDIQRCALPVALEGLDVMGAAKTGSGKTLAFLVPVLERLYREKWTVYDGLGALILSPTRELALQTFEVLRRIGKYQGLSAGLVIGGKNLKAEQDAISRMNILVATPGRLLQHMDQTSVFDWNNLKILVLDEADRILDLGFARTIDAILAELPKHGRQAMLFSATQSKEVGALAERLNLKDPVQMSVHSSDVSATPSQLTQKYIVCGLEEKMDRLFSFLKSNLKSKVLVFLSSCKQVRFVYEAFCKLQPGTPLLHLHGRQKQPKRMAIFYEFCKKSSACLFATDVAARGLDFPAVDWVVQLDCPEEVETYIHRVGRTARFDRVGNALLFLLPSEVAIVEDLRKAKVPIVSLYSEGRPAPPPKRPIQGQLQALCSQDPELKYLAQKALVSYVRSVFLHGGAAKQRIFKVSELPVDAFARSLGLASTPRLRFAERSVAKNRNRQQDQISSSSSESESLDKAAVDSPQLKAVVRKIDKMFKKKNSNVFSTHYANLRDDESKPKQGEDVEDLLTVKRRDHEIDPEVLVSANTVSPKISRRAALKTKKKFALKEALKNAPAATRLVFDEEGEAYEAFPFAAESTFDRSQASKLTNDFVSEEIKGMRSKDREDAERQRQTRRVVRIEKKRKAKDKVRNAHLAKAPRINASNN